MKSNTIAAIATPMTNSGIGIIRISGDEALDIIEKVFKPKKKDKKIKDVKTYTGDCCGATFLLCELSFYMGFVIIYQTI